jgi:transketolase
VREINDKRVREVAEKARAIRRHIVTMLCAAGSGHTGGSLSASDIVACLYFWEMNLDPANPDWEDRDRFVLSKGHAAPVLYAALAERGFFPRNQALLSFPVISQSVPFYRRCQREALISCRRPII